MTRTDEILALVEGPSVLDIGCAGHVVKPKSPAWLHGRLRERFDVTGIDVNADNIDALKTLGFDNLSLQSADDFNLPARFNTIVAGEVLEHISNPGNFFACAKKHLLPGGRLVITTPYVFSLMYAFYAAHHFPRTCENREHIGWFCPSTIGELARREGLVVETWCLVDDYDPEVTSIKYRLYWKLAHSVGKLFPDKITKTTILAVLKPAA